MAAKNESHRLTLRFSEEDYERLRYWANRSHISINALILKMLDQWIGIQNGDYELPTLEIQRLNQLVDAVEALRASQRSLESVVISGFDSLVSMTRGDNYILEHDVPGAPGRIDSCGDLGGLVINDDHIGGLNGSF